MSRHASRHNKRDENEPEILRAIAKMGVDWIEAGPLDGWIYLGDHGFIPAEIKMPGEQPTDDQQEFIDFCRREGRPVMLWYSVADALSDINARRQWRRQ